MKLVRETTFHLSTNDGKDTYELESARTKLQAVDATLELILQGSLEFEGFEAVNLDDNFSDVRNIVLKQSFNDGSWKCEKSLVESIIAESKTFLKDAEAYLKNLQACEIKVRKMIK